MSEDIHGITRRELGLGAAAVAVGAASLAMGADAAGATNPAPPLTRGTISMEEAQRVLAAAVERAKAINVAMFIMIVDESNVEKASVRMDGNGLASLTLVPLKAKTAVSFRTSTLQLGTNVQNDPLRMHSFLNAGFTLIGGGIPITRNNQVIGAIGVGGGSPAQDHDVAEAGLRALG